MQFFKKIIKNPLISADLSAIRELIFNRLLLAYAVLGFIAYVPSVILAVIYNLWLIVAIDTVGYSVIILFVVSSSIKTEVKVLITLLISLSIGVVLLIEVGPFGAGYFWIFAVPIIAAILLKYWYSITALIINVFLFILIGFLQYYGLLKWNEFYSFNIYNWLILAVNFILLNIGTTISLAVLIKRLEKSLEREKAYGEKLILEHKELIKAKRTAENANKLKSEFLAQMSHEIRTPINTVMSYVSLLKDELESREDELIKDSFKMIELGTMRILRTIDSILSMSELQTGSYEPIFAEKNIHSDILSPLYEEFRIYALNKSLEFTQNFEKKDFSFNCDVYTMTQLFANLIDNAIKYTDNGYIRISSAVDKNGNFYVSISDSGIGMSDEYLKRIYEPFSQEDQGYSRKFKGTGLGLSLVKKYAEINNVKIEVVSKKEEGTIFLVVFQ